MCCLKFVILTLTGWRRKYKDKNNSENGCHDSWWFIVNDLVCIFVLRVWSNIWIVQWIENFIRHYSSKNHSPALQKNYQCFRPSVYLCSNHISYIIISKRLFKKCVKFSYLFGSCICYTIVKRLDPFHSVLYKLEKLCNVICVFANDFAIIHRMAEINYCFLLKIGQFASKAKSKNYVGSFSRTEQFLPKKTDFRV